MKSSIFCLIFLIGLFLSSVQVYSFDTLKPIGTVILEENDDIIFKNISSIALSPNMKNIAVVNGSWLTLSVHSTETGKILNYFLTDTSLCKYFTDKAEALFEPNYYFPTYTIFGIDTSRLMGFDNGRLINTLHKVQYINDTTIMSSGIFRAWGLDTTETNLISRKNGPLIFNNTGFLLFDKNLSLKYGTTLESDSYKFACVEGFYRLNDTSFIFPVFNCVKTNNPDSLPAFAIFMKNGKRQNIVSMLDEDYINSKLFYEIFLNFSICKIKEKYLWTTLADYKIRNLLDKNDFFELKGFDSTNKESWKSSLGTWTLNLCLNVKKMDVWQDSLIAVFTTNKNSNIQFYDINGNLIKHYILEKHNKVKVLDVAFASKYNKIYAISKDDENYYINEYEVR